MPLIQKIKFNNWYMKKVPAVYFECMNVPPEFANESYSIKKMFVNEPLAVVYNLVRKPDFDNLSLEKDGYNKLFGHDCVEWFVDKMLEMNT